MLTQIRRCNFNQIEFEAAISRADIRHELNVTLLPTVMTQTQPFIDTRVSAVSFGSQNISYNSI